ncbi:unnamed protein product [Adineta ricciae]|nr:unnamed protein product [Adineta ricciae]
MSSKHRSLFPPGLAELDIFPSKSFKFAMLNKIIQDHIDVINYAKEDVVVRVLELSENQGVDIAYDSIYVESSFAKSLVTVRQDGT